MGYKVMQIEVSNLCSLTCSYCPHPTQRRPKGDMSFETFTKCVELVRRSDNPQHQGRKYVGLNHFGEPLLHPQLTDFIRYAVANDLVVSFATNGVDYDRQLFPRERWRELRDAGLERVQLSAHVKSEKTLRDHIGDIVEVIGVWKPIPVYLHDWVGQVDMSRYRMQPPEAPDGPCDYELHDMFAVRWDGMLAACCYDSEGLVGVSVDEVLERGYSFRPIRLCAGCTLGRGDVEWLLTDMTAKPAPVRATPTSTS